MARVRVLYFAVLRDVAGVDEDAIEASSTGEIFDRAIALHPDLAGYRSVNRIAKNAQFVQQNEALADGDEIALLPPVSGG